MRTCAAGMNPAPNREINKTAAEAKAAALHLWATRAQKQRLGERTLCSHTEYSSS